MESIVAFAERTGIFAFMNSTWGWPAMESVHFVGLSLLIGTVGVFDLRMLGLARGVPLAALHRLVPFGVGGYLLNVGSGLLFIAAAPDQYLFNPAFQLKMLFMALAGCNMMLFYLTTSSAVKATPADRNPGVGAMVFATISLTCWVGVITFGRLITVFRPPYHWCFWC